MWAGIINIILGVLLMLAPSQLGLSDLASNNLHVVGPLVITVAITSLWDINRSVRYANIACGSWLIISPLVLGFAFNWLVFAGGLLVMLLSLVKGKVKAQYGGGWRSLWQKYPAHLE